MTSHLWREAATNDDIDFCPAGDGCDCGEHNPLCRHGDYLEDCPICTPVEG